MDKMTKIILASAIGITLVGVVFIMGLVMKLSTATTENSNLVKQITDQNSSIKDNNAEVEKQMKAPFNKQKLENENGFNCQACASLPSNATPNSQVGICCSHY